MLFPSYSHHCIFIHYYQISDCPIVHKIYHYSSIVFPYYHHYYLIYIYIHIPIIFSLYSHHYWLVVSTPLKHESPNIWKVIKAMFQTTNQL